MFIFFLSVLIILITAPLFTTGDNGSTEAGGACVTVSGPDTGSPCIFPFFRDNKPYTSCATNNDGVKWCDTQVDNPATGWGYCNEDCNPISTDRDRCEEDPRLYLCGDVCLEKSKPCHATGACYPGDNLHVCGDTCLEKWQPCNGSCSQLLWAPLVCSYYIII